MCHIDILKRNWFKHIKGRRHIGMENFLRPPLKQVNTITAKKREKVGEATAQRG